MAATTHYLDHAATTPMLPAAVAVMRAALSEVGNASSLHTSGRRARKQVEESREEIASALGALPSEVVFTSGGTEGDNLGLKGLYWSRRAADPGRRRVLVGATEHHAVLDAASWLGAHEGAEVELLPVAGDGRIRPNAVADSIARSPGTVALVSCMWANNEVGTVQPIADVAALAHAHGIPVHTDAVQAAGPLPVDFGASDVDMLTVSGHKLGGAVGSGALVVRRELDLVPLLHGGGQEREVRPGTLAVAAVRGLAIAVTHAVQHRAEEAARLAWLRDDLERRVAEVVPDVQTVVADERLPGLAHLTFAGCDGDALLMLLDARGVECSTGSACSAGVPQPSHVLLAMGRDTGEASSALRVSLGHTSTPADVDAFVAAIGPATERARDATRVAVAPGRR